MSWNKRELEVWFFVVFFFTIIFSICWYKASIVFLPEQKIKSPNVTISAGGCDDVNLSI